MSDAGEPDASSPREHDRRREVVARSHRSPLRSRRRARGPIRHIVFVVKETHVRPGVRPAAGVDGTRRSRRSPGDDRQERRRHARGRTRDVSPNHSAGGPLAISDNFYCDADQSTPATLGRGVYPNEWVEVNARSRIEARLFSTARRRYVSAAVRRDAEDYNEPGALGAPRSARRAVLQLRLRHRDAASLETQAYKETHPDGRLVPLPSRCSTHVADLRHVQHAFRSVPDGHVEQELSDRWLSGRSVPRWYAGAAERHLTRTPATAIVLRSYWPTTTWPRRLVHTCRARRGGRRCSSS